MNNLIKWNCKSTHKTQKRYKAKTNKVYVIKYVYRMKKYDDDSELWNSKYTEFADVWTTI